MKRHDQELSMRAENMRIRPLRHKPGAPMMGSNLLKPFRKPDGPIKTLNLHVRKTKPVRGLKP